LQFRTGGEGLVCTFDFVLEESHVPLEDGFDHYRWQRGYKVL